MPFLVRDLIEGRGEPVTVPRDCSAKQALEVMIEHDFSQLPVVAEGNRPLGMVTGDSILRSLSVFDVKLNALKVPDALLKVNKEHEWMRQLIAQPFYAIKKALKNPHTPLPTYIPVLALPQR